MTRNAGKKQLTLNYSISVGSAGINAVLGSKSAPFPFVSALELSLPINAWGSDVCAFAALQKAVCVCVCASGLVTISACQETSQPVSQSVRQSVIGRVLMCDSVPTAN